MKVSLFVLIIIFIGLLVGAYSFWGEIEPVPQASQLVEVESTASVVVDAPVSHAVVSSPLTITGKARGNWFFEASFPVEIIDVSGSVLGSGIAQAQGEWMTEEYVPFTTTVVFSKPTTTKGFVLLKKDNPSGLPENDATIAIPITFTQ